MRTDINRQHLPLGVTFSTKIDKMINKLDKKIRMAKKLHAIANHIKANGMYSQQEMEYEKMNMDQLKTNPEEKKLIQAIWEARHTANKEIMNDAKKLLKEFKDQYEK